MFGDFGGLPLHPLVVHAVVIFLMGAGTGVIALALRPAWRHKYGFLVVGVTVAGVLSTWLAVQSGNILTRVPGLGSDAHKAGGDLLLWLTLPWMLVTAAMIYFDWKWLVALNKYGEPYRIPYTTQPWRLRIACVVAVVASVAVMGQTAAVGHSGAEASWGDVNVTRYE